MGSTVAAPRRELLSVRLVAAVALLCAPTLLAFFSGGFFDQPRLWAGLLIWLLLAAAALAGAPVIPRRSGGRLALAGLALLSALTLASIAWAPLGGRAFDDGQRAVLYLGTLAAAAALFRGVRVTRLVEPLLAAGTVIVIGYGLAGRLLPAVVDQEVSRQALGRFDQPLTYWNAVGAVAALGLVLCARLACGRARTRHGGEAEDEGWVEVGRRVDVVERDVAAVSAGGVTGRALAAAACAPLGAGLYLTFSRGAIAAAVVGLIALAALLPARAALRSLTVASLGAVGGALAVAFFGEVTDPRTGSGEIQGALALVLLVAVASTAALASWWVARRSSGGERSPHGRLAALAIAVALVGVIALALAGVSGIGGERVAGTPADGPSAQRLSSVESQRYDYWDVALRAFARDPLQGVGAGGFKVEWWREQPDGAAPASDAHSLYVETAAELGLLGLVALALLFVGVGLAAARALWLRPELGAGPVAVLVAWSLHAGLDWDWEMPAVTLIAVLLAGLLVALAEDQPAPDPTG